MKQDWRFHVNRMAHLKAGQNKTLKKSLEKAIQVAANAGGSGGGGTMDVVALRTDLTEALRAYKSNAAGHMKKAVSSTKKT